MKIRICLALVATSLCSTHAVSLERITQRVTHLEALAVARRAAIAKGYDMTKYSLINDGVDLNPGDKDWFFLYVCKQPAVDCGFSVNVNRATSAVEIQSLP